MRGLPLHIYHSQYFSLTTVYLSLVLTIFMAYLATSSSACPEVFRCGNRTFEYPFGAKSSGCGDPALQLECDRKVNMISLTINGYQYYLLRPFGHRKEFPIKYMTIVDRNIWGDACDPSTSNHTMEFWSSPQFRISDEYMNISLWGECSEDIREYQPTELYVLECNKTWYYSEWNLDTYCKSLVHLPAQKLGRSNRPLLGSIYNGFPIKWDFSKGCEHCESKKELCIYDISNSTQLSCKGGSDTAKRTAIALGCSVGGVSLMAALAMLCILYVKRRKRAHTRELRGDKSKYQRSVMEAGYPMYKIGNLSIFPYQELHQATNFFDEEKLLGDGGYGVVYLGKLNDGRAVAVKRLYQDSCRTVEQFLNEVQILSSLCHPNLVRLYGCTCPQSPMLLLVYEFMPNGTLSDHLHGSRRTLTGLPWATRLNIAIQTAQALAYLHNFNPPILHRDVKSSNILLDEDFRAKVGDFGLSRLMPLNVSHITTAPQGTLGYVDPEYHQCFQLTEKSDVYSLGVVLMEIISAKVAVDTMRNRNEISLANMATDRIRRGVLDELVDPDLRIGRNHEVKVTVAAAAELAFECLAIERDFRPTMKEVVARLTDIKEMLQESTESSNSISESPASSLISLQENCSA
ncbi:LEAF RUST 10 DISEASE-RESISTANCE LOCUS RECEPTOR-LIKE PROTEIN KINASE-like 1.4 [Cryptomeria japonica]|uniref:LEAF RUST 10 DISEASE-RESISTANCE LOCUS RECEPTOR-LIKE PROTEIN KINASE-like 1.4 n=1 Tax=Cryptomeria japonica TaxID=3369 RepID=UPI0027DA4DBD|nr:LEAF RUST 10 DISEASE-RESISTANCE LOCUS RECEPTOR-LIKE PROTEIN KINASE-like 1.4 [Cryptomeria japonica]